MTSHGAAPPPSPEGAPFWAAARRGELVLPRCANCEQFFFYPRTGCPGCGSRDVAWERVSGRGRVYAFCIHYQSDLSALHDRVPFVTAIVELDEGPRLPTMLVEVEPSPEAMRCDLTVEVAFTELADGSVVPVFRPEATSP